MRKLLAVIAAIVAAGCGGTAAAMVIIYPAEWVGLDGEGTIGNVVMLFGVGVTITAALVAGRAAYQYVLGRPIT